MYIKSVTIDGFKSYGKPVELHDFDNQFNAITGLNGTGKSNILDAICFVLGQTNMAQARVSNLRELIFKNGQSGVVKAKVSITFDNTDPKNCPLSYENYKEIVVTREVNLQNRSKYFINGFVAQNLQVIEDLFHSVQLNIKNPHFLIMQGRITKVLNMKPQEVLSMVEEATGASRYEGRKKACQTSIERKEVALRNIDSLLHEQIGPNLDKLKLQMKGLNDYKKISAELESKNKILIAWNYVTLQDQCQNTGSKVSETNKLIEKLEQDCESNTKSIKEIQTTIAKLEQEKNHQFGESLTHLEEKLREVQQQESKSIGVMNNKKEILNDLNRKKKNILKQKEDEAKVLKSKDKEHDKLKETFDKLEEQSNEDAARLQKAQDDFEAISAGASRAADGDASKSLSEQMLNAKKELASVTTEEKKEGMKIQHLKETLDGKKKEAAKRKGNEGTDRSNYDKVDKEVKNLDRQLQSLNFDETSHREKIRQRKELANEVDLMRREVENQEHHSHVGFRLNQEYHEPFRGFKHENILGMICELFSIKDVDAALALEVAVGSKLKNVVVKDQETAKALLEKGGLQRSFTFLPLDRIQGKPVSDSKLRTAQQLVGKNNVKSAISLIDFEPHLTTAIEYAFGDVFVCTDMEVAKKVAFDPRIRVRCVTLSGEDFSPAGTLSGGCRDRGNDLLVKMAELTQLKEQLRVKNDSLRSMEEQLKSSDQLQKQYSEMKRQLDLKTQELDFLRQAIENTNSYILQREIEEIEDELKALESKRTEYPQIKKALDAKIKDLDYKMKNSESIRNKELKEADDILKKAQKKSEASRKEVEKRKHTVETLRIEIADLIAALEGLNNEIKTIEEDCQAAEKDFEEAKEQVSSIQTQVTELKNKVNEKKTQLKSKNDDIHKLLQKSEQLSKDSEGKKLEIRKLEHQIESIEKEATDAAKTLRHLVKNNPWIEEEKEDFGNEKAGYPLKKTDFNPGKIKGDIINLTNKKNALAKTVNMRANHLLVDQEKEFEEVTKKRSIVEQDKVKLLQYMKEVDMKRKDELKKAFKTINDHLGSIFRSLLPGSDAKLEAPLGKTIHDGLEIKVAFGGVWKESLTELSGGQRSLVALSLVLALLRYNPAPIYILDEVDAALDQNHTTNIGQMIKANFPDSQVCFLSIKLLNQLY